MKIADGKVMTAREIRAALSAAHEILSGKGLKCDYPGEVGSHIDTESAWRKVVAWLRSRTKTRTGKQVAAAFLSEMAIIVTREGKS